MSQLKIVDLDFCERELPSKSGVKGGLGISSSSFSLSYSPRGDTASARYSTTGNTDLNVDYSYVGRSRAFETVPGTVASAIAVGDYAVTSTVVAPV